MELNPKAVDAWLVMGTYHQASGQYDKAGQEFRRAMDVDPKNPEPRAALARLFLAQGKKAEAEEFLKQAKRDFPDNSAGYRLLGDFYFTTGDLAKLRLNTLPSTRNTPKISGKEKLYSDPHSKQELRRGTQAE